MSSTHPMQNQDARAQYLGGRVFQVLGALCAGAGFWLTGSFPAAFGWVAVLAGAALHVLGRRSARRAWEHLPATRQDGSEPAWLTVLADGVAITAVGAGLLIAVPQGPLPALLAVGVGGAGMYLGYRSLRSGPKGASLAMRTVLLLVGVVLALAGMRELFS